MIEKIPDAILNIHDKFIKAGFEIYLVGGCVRDLFLNHQTKDWDFTTNATPEEILRLFPDGFYDNTFGTVGIPIKTSSTSFPLLSGEGSEGEVTTKEETTIVEVTTFRSEKGYSNRRHPDEVSWGTSIEEDLKRRDFTVNAIALQLQPAGLTDKTPRVTDPLHGREDIEKKLIRAVGDPNIRLQEDALRLMRAIRLATQLSFSIEEKTLEAITTNASLLNEISKERIRDEFLKILASDYPYEGIMLLRNTNLLEYILPELLEGVGVSQERPGRHHKEDVFTHNVLSLRYAPSIDPIVRFATLIHDIGKPRVASVDKDGFVIFHNHEIIGAKIASQICERLRFSNKQKGRIVTLVRWHMFTVDEKITDAAVRRFIRRVGVENVKDMMDLRIGDRLGGGTQTAESWRLKLFKNRVEEQLAPAPFSIEDLAIDGNDIMHELQIKPGPQVGHILQKLFEEVDEDLSKNTREYLLKRIGELNT